MSCGFLVGLSSRSVEDVVIIFTSHWFIATLCGGWKRLGDRWVEARVCLPHSPHNFPSFTKGRERVYFPNWVAWVLEKIGFRTRLPDLFSPDWGSLAEHHAVHITPKTEHRRMFWVFIFNRMPEPSLLARWRVSSRLRWIVGCIFVFFYFLKLLEVRCERFWSDGNRKSSSF